MQKEYVVTLHNYDDLDSFYEEMETQGKVSNFNPNRVPEREVECTLRRSISRNTHYLLTEEEAEILRKDRRVLAVELLPSELGLKVTPHWSQTAEFQKSPTFTSSQKNWGLRRCIGAYGFPGNVNSWAFPVPSGGSSTSTTTIQTTSSGKNVDVVIVDAHINPNHPEFAVNADGTGGSRVNQFDWFQYSSALGYTSSGSYSYSTVSSNHGTHVAGTVAGNTQGWARDAKIYNMEFDYSGATTGSPRSGQIVTSDWALYIFDYLRYFHKNKSINAATGRRNPTITNHSWGYSYGYIPLSSVSGVNYRGVTTTVSGTDAQRKATLESNGVPVPFNTFLYATPARYAALDADIQDAINDGVVVISSAGNSYWKMDVPGGLDYNNYFIVPSGGVNYAYYHSQGSSPGSADNVICVGSLGSNPDLEQRSDFSNCGPRVDVYAPGSNIISSVYDSTAATEFEITLANDPRSSSYKIGSISGTSMASPQVAGAMACLAEQYPRINNSFVLNYLKEKSTSGVYGGSGSSTSPYRNTQGSPNRLLAYRQERLIPGSLNLTYFDATSTYGSVVVQPREKFNTRSASNLKYPRRGTLFTKLP